MAILTSKFDVLRGWPKEGAIDETFPVYSPGGTPVAIPSGSVIYLRTDGTVDLVSVGSNPAAVWLVVEGNDDYSGAYLQKVVALRGNCVVQTSNFEAGSWAVSSMVSYTLGQFSLAASGEQVVGEVLKDDRATNGTLTIYFHGGLTEAP